MIIQETPWQSQSKTSRDTGIAPRDLTRLYDQRTSKWGWVILRKEIDRPKHIFQRYCWKALRLGEWSGQTIKSDLEVPLSWFGAISKIRTSHETLTTIARIESDLDLLTCGEVSGTLQRDREEALKVLGAGVKVLVDSEPVLRQLQDVKQLLTLFNPFRSRMVPEKVKPVSENSSACTMTGGETKPRKLERVLIVGGRPQNYRIQKLSKEFGIPHIIWPDYDPKTNTRARKGPLSRVSNGKYDAVLVITQYVSHNQYWAFRDAAKASGTIFIHADTVGRQSLSNALREAIEFPTGH